MPPRNASAATAGGGRKRKRARKARTNAALEASSSSSSSSSSDDSSSSDEEDPSPVKPLGLKGKNKAVVVNGDGNDSDPSSSSSSSSSSDSSDSSSSSSSKAEAVASSAVLGDTQRRPRRRAASPEPVYDDEAILEAAVYQADRSSGPSSLAAPRLGQLTSNAPLPTKSQPTPLPKEAQDIIEAKRRREADSKKSSHQRRREQEATNDEDDGLRSKARKEAFEALWMSAVTSSLGDELDGLRKREPNLTLPGKDSRLPLLIDVLAGGAERFTTARGGASSSARSGVKGGEATGRKQQEGKEMDIVLDEHARLNGTE